MKMKHPELKFYTRKELFRGNNGYNPMALGTDDTVTTI
jgi:hypothetical protein